MLTIFPYIYPTIRPFDGPVICCGAVPVFGSLDDGEYLLHFIDSTLPPEEVGGGLTLPFHKLSPALRMYMRVEYVNEMARARQRFAGIRLLEDKRDGKKPPHAHRRGI